MHKKRVEEGKHCLLADKRAQVTVFIIVGILILFVAGAYFYFSSQEVEKLINVPEITENIPAEMQSVRAYVERCVEQTATDAIQLIGMHGGYIGVDADSQEFTGKSFSGTVGVTEPTESDVLSVVDSGEWSVPYWYYMKSANDATSGFQFESQIPPLRKDGGQGSVEEQVNKYVNLNLQSCLGNFATLEQRGYTIEPAGEIVTNTIIAETETIVFVTYPIKASIQDRESTVSQYRAVIDVNLAKIYRLANEITQIEGDSLFLEQHALNVITAFSGMDEDMLPPMAGTELEYAPKLWSQSAVVEDLQDLFTVYISALQASNTQNFRLDAIQYDGDDLRSAFYRYMVVPVNGVYSDISVEFNYWNWPIYFYIMDQDPIGPRQSATLPLIGAVMPIQQYNLPYDVSFPVLIHLRNNGALDGKGYDFFFSLEGNIRNNEAVGPDTFIASGLPSADSTICELDQRTSGEVSFRVQGSDNSLVEGAVVSYNVGDSSCILGQTEINGDYSSFSSKLPKGSVGTLSLFHQDYEPYTSDLILPGENAKILDTIVLKKAAVLPVTIKKLNVQKEVYGAGLFSVAEWIVSPIEHPLTDGEEVVIILTKQKNNPSEPDFNAVVNMVGDSVGEIRLVPGIYDGQVILVKDRTTVIIPEETRKEGGVAGIGEKTITLPKIQLSKNGPYTTRYELLNIIFDESIYDNKQVNFKVLYFDLPGVPEVSRTHDDLEKYSGLQKIADEASNALMPRVESR